MVVIIIEKIDHVLAPLELGWSDLQTTLDCGGKLYLWRVDPSNLSSLVGELFVTCIETIKVAENMKEIILTDSNDQLLSEVGSLRSNISDLGAGLEESLAVTAGFRVWDDKVSGFQGYSKTFSGCRDILRLLQTWNPDGLFWLVRLVLVRLLHVHAGKQELGGIRVDRTLHQLDVARHDGAKGNLQYYIFEGVNPLRIISLNKTVFGKTQY